MTDSATPAPHTHHLRVQRTARYYTLGGSSPERRAIWFVLHGYGQLAGVFVRYFSDLASNEDLVVAPEAMNRFYLTTPDKAPARERPVGATWMTREDRASDIADYVEYLDALFDDVAADAAQSGAAINVIGFSQGAATATRWITHTSRRIDRLILWGGLLPPETDLANARLSRVRLTLIVGSRDHYIDDAALAAERARLEGAGFPHDVIRFEGGHVVTRGVFARLTDGGSAIGASER